MATSPDSRIFAKDVSTPVSYLLQTLIRWPYAFFVKDNPFTWTYLDGKRNPLADTEGPFYVFGAPNRNIEDGKGVLASRKILEDHAPFLWTGRVTGADGTPLPHALVDIWQVRYNDLLCDYREILFENIFAERYEVELLFLNIHVTRKDSHRRRRQL
jgi:hypothetical protein